MCIKPTEALNDITGFYWLIVKFTEGVRFLTRSLRAMDSHAYFNLTSAAASTNSRFQLPKHFITRCYKAVKAVTVSNQIDFLLG